MDTIVERLKNMTPLQRAVFALKETQARLDALERKRAEPIAIVGMACHFPGGASDPASYWRLLCEGVDAIGEIPSDRWNVDAFYDPDPAAPGKMCTRWGGFLDRIDEFDNHFFGISDREATRLDPQQRMLLELAWEALEDAGLPPGGLRGGKVGVFIGISVSEYGLMLSSDVSQTDAYVAAGTSLCLAANRLSFALGLQGPSMALDTACSSSLVAVHLACQHIRNGECDAALVGGANLLLSPTGTINLTKAGFCAADGRVRAFDAKASGYVRSEGVGIVVLKPLSAALNDRDSIYAIIRGSAVNQNGSSNGLTAPSRVAQERVLREAYAQSKVSPGLVQFVETQGTGTRLGDTIEATALGNVLRENRAPGNRCALGALKTNLGHLEAASGIASLMKAALALKHGQLPGNLHFEAPNPDIPFDALPLRVQRRLEAWPASEHGRFAGVSAFGFGGSNAHVVLEQPPEEQLGSDAGQTSQKSLPSPDHSSVSARRGTGGEGLGGENKESSCVLPSDANSPHPNPLPKGEGTSVCPESLAKGEGIRHLLPLSARTDKALHDLADRYGQFLGDGPPSWSDICYTAGARREHHDCRLAVLADLTTHAADALRSLAETPSEPLAVSQGATLFSGRKPYGRSLRVAFLYDNRVDNWKSCVRHLLDDVPNFAAAAKEVDAVLRTTAGWSLTSILDENACWDDPRFARPALLALQLALTAWWRAAGINPDVVLGHGVGELAAACAAGILTAEDALQLAMHNGAGNGVPIRTRSASLPFLSSVDGQSHLGPDIDASHWQSCLRPCQGLDTALAALVDRQIDVCLEVGPAGQAFQPVLRVLPSLVPTPRGRVDVLTAMGALYAAGADIRWQHVAAPEARCVRVPTYPWQRQRLWAPVNKWLTGSPVEFDKVSSLSLEEVRVRPDLTVPYIAPRTTLEQTMADAWRKILGVDRVGVHDNFFELGGDSLQAAILLNVVADHLGRSVSLPLREMFQTPTISELSRRIEAVLSDNRVTSQPSLTPIARNGELPLSLNQEALWFLDRLEPERPTYMLHLALNVKGPLDISALERALGEIARRHEVLRTIFPEVNGRPVQVIAPPGPQSLPMVDLSDLPDSEREVQLRRRIAAEMGRPIDLQNGPLIRITLLRRAENDHAVVASTHHIIHDGWSMGILLRELAVLYAAYTRGRTSPLPELPIQYVDFAAWQRQWLQGETLERLRSYWRDQLSGVPPLELPTDYPRPAIRTTRGSSRPCRLSPETSAAVLEYCRREGVTPFMTLLAAFQVLLKRYSGQDDFALGVPVANRNRAETETLIGYFVNVVVLRSKLSGDISFREAVARARQTAIDAFERQEMTLDQVVDAVKPPRDLSRNPLFQAMFALQNIKLPPAPEMNLQVSPLEDSPAPPSANFDLTLELFERKDGFQGSLNFSTDLFDPATIDRMVSQYQVLVAAAVAEPDRSIASLPLLEEEQSQRMLVQWNDTAREYDRSRLVHHLFEAQAARQPDATAIVSDDRRWSYRELNERSNEFARFLQEKGVGPEVRVGICLERSPELLMAVLGVLKAGGAYVPLDPAYTQDAAERIGFVLRDARVSMVVTDSTLSASLDVGQMPRPNVDGGATADNLAYILYTSGSTGRPKGVMVTQGNLLNAYHGWEHVYRLDKDIRSHLQMASFAFDVFGGDWVRALCSGGKLVICRKEILLDPEQLLGLMRREEVEAAEFVPIVLRNLVQYLEETGQSLDFMRLVVVGSDAWYAADHRRARRVLAPSARLINTYGLTETTIDSSYFEGDAGSLSDTAITPIGRPFANVRLYVLDEQMRPTPIGVPGELYIGGDGVSRGYVDRALGAARFVPDPFAAGPEARLCRTGDRARWRVDGQVEFLGRGDNQVKIRGFRVEPGEVEQVLREHPLLADAAVIALERTAGDVHLAAYVVGGAEAAPDISEVRQYLAQRLPDYMIPSTFAILDALPTTTSGKVDRKALPAPDWSQAAFQGEYVAPSTPVEVQLAAIWSDVLGIERIGASDNFFDLGGNSLLLLRLAARVRKDFAVELPLATLFAAPSVAELAGRIVTLQAAGRTVQLPPIQTVPRSGPLPASFAQEGFWFIEQLLAGATILNMHGALRLLGQLDVDALRQTVNEIVRRHEILRTSFATTPEGILVQVVAPQLSVELPFEDLGDVPERKRAAHVKQLARLQAAEPFDLGQTPLFRIRLLRLSDAEHILLLTTHHIICDGWSLDVLGHEVTHVYDAVRAGQPSPLPELAVQYADYAVWQRNYLQGEVIESLLSYWRNKLEGLAQLELPTDRPREAALSRNQQFVDFRISNRVKIAANRLGSEEGATPYMLFLAAFQAMLHRYTGSNDVAIGSIVANRRLRETQGMIGLFVNTLVLRGDLSGDPSFRELLARVRQTAVEAFEHQELPFERLVGELQPQRDMSRHPLVQVLLNFHQRTTSQRVERRRELAIELDDADPMAEAADVFDLVLELTDEPHGLRGQFTYNDGLFDRATVDRMAVHFQKLFEVLVADPDQRISQPALEGLPPVAERQSPHGPQPVLRASIKAKPRYVAPQTDLEKQLAAIWGATLRLDRVGLHDNFFEIGGHSLLAVQVMVQTRAAAAVDLPVAALFAAPTVAELAERIETARRGEPDIQPRDIPLVHEFAASLLQQSHGNGQSLALLRPGAATSPLFCIHGLGGHIAAFLPLAEELGDRPVYGLQGLGLEAGQQPHDRIEQMAACYLDEIRGVQPRGPYLLGGWSMGGLIAMEAARQLVATGEETALLAMFDTHLSTTEYEALDLTDQSVIRWIAPHLNLSLKELRKLPLEQQWERIAERANLAEGIGVTEIRRLAAVCRAHLAAAAYYRPQTHAGRAVLFQADMGRGGLDRRWQSLCPTLQVERVPGNHYSMLRKPDVDVLAERLRWHLDGVVAPTEMAGNR